MDAAATVACGSRPSKRRREGDSDLSGERHPPKKKRNTLCPIKAASHGVKLSLVEEMKRLMDENPPLASTTMEFLDLYLFLWESYVIDSARKIRLEEEQRRLQAENAWHVRANNRLYQACADRELVLWDRQEALDSVQQAVIKVVKLLQVPLTIPVITA